LRIQSGQNPGEKTKSNQKQAGQKFAAEEKTAHASESTFQVGSLKVKIFCLGIDYILM
jgi:hypothetical protein